MWCFFAFFLVAIVQAESSVGDSEVAVGPRTPGKAATETSVGAAVGAIKACVYDANTNYEGAWFNQDLPGMPISKNNKEDCAQACWENTNCEYFVFGHPNKCWLKKNFRRKVSSNGATSGVRCNPHPERCVFDPKKNYVGPWLNQDLKDQPITQKTKEHCAQACWDNPKCEYFVFGAEQKCWLKKNYLRADGADSSTVSGFRCNPRQVITPECPADYFQVGTLTQNNDIWGAAEGQLDQETISDCQKVCEANEVCEAFMYSGNTKQCEIAKTRVPNNGYGTHQRFCAKKVCDYDQGKNWRGTLFNEDLPHQPTSKLNKEKCAEACWQNASCQYFVFDGASKNCWLKKNFNDNKDNASGSVVSGYRCDPSASTPAAPVQQTLRHYQHRASAEASVGESAKTSFNSFGLVALCGIFGAIGYAFQRYSNKGNIANYEKLTEMI